MKRRVHHKRPSMLTRLLIVALMTALSANSLLAAAFAGSDCDRRCPCCTAAKADSRMRLSAERPAGCCGPVQAAPCRMSTGDFPTAAPALVTVHHHASVANGHPMLAATMAGDGPTFGRSPLSRLRAGPDHLSIPLFLQTSRLIC